MKKRSGLFVFAAFVMLAVVFTTCEISSQNNEGDGKLAFIMSPSLSLVLEEGGVICTWTPSLPDADRYYVYYKKGDYTADELSDSATIMPTTGLSAKINTVPAEGDILSVMVLAYKDGYADIASPVKKITGAGTVIDPQEPLEPTVSNSVKRGVGYNFTTLRQGQNNNTTWTERDMDLLTGGRNGIKWFYSWGINPNPAVVTAAARRGMVFYPMTWNNNYNEQNIRTIVSQMPDIEYILAYNEPNFLNQANMTPAEAAAAWPKLKAVANELGLKIISPAMNFAGERGNRLPYDPIEWLDEFFEQPGVSLDDIDGIAVHTYPWWPSAVKGILDNYRKYGKRLWLTEFCGWEDLQQRENTWELQAWYLSQALVYLEMDPMVERYAWYLPKGHVAETQDNRDNPYHNLLTEVNAATQPQLTELGKIYTNMTTLNKDLWIPAGTKIDAAQFTNCNLESTIGVNNSWQDIVLSMPTDDSDRSAGILEIRDFSNNKWVEYQISTPSAKNYTLTLRYKTAGASQNMQISVDGGAAVTATLNSAAWTETTVNLGSLSAGGHTVRIRATSGGNSIGTGSRLNWLRVD